MGAKLTVVAGPSRGAEVALEGRIIFNIGSDRGSSVFLDDARVAPNHCRLYNEESKFTLFDVSGKGMDVNGKRVVKAVLLDGDVISLGDTRLRFATSAGGDAFGRSGVGAPMGASPMGGVPMGGGPPGSDFQLDLGGGAVGRPRSTGYARVWLKCVEGNDKGKTFDLSEGTCWVLGRGHSADITVMDIKVSRAHTRIDRQGDAFFVSDLNSTNGSFVNGQQVERQQLQRGDYIKLGYTILSFQYETLEETGGQSGQILDPAAVAGLHDDPFSRELGSVSGGAHPSPGAPHAGAGLPSAPLGAGPPPFAPGVGGGAPPYGAGIPASPPGFPPPGGGAGRYPPAPLGAPSPPPFAPPFAPSGAGGAPPFAPSGAGGAPPFAPSGAGGPSPFAPPGAGGPPPFPSPGAATPGAGAGLPPAAAPTRAGRTAPGMPSAGDFEDMELDVSALDDADELFAPAAAGSGAFPPPGSGAFPPPGAQTLPAAARGRLQTRDLAVPDMDDDLFGAPSPAPAPASGEDVQCFLCNRTFGAGEVASGRVRKVQENYYCQGCLGGG